MSEQAQARKKHNVWNIVVYVCQEHNLRATEPEIKVYLD